MSGKCKAKMRQTELTGWLSTIQAILTYINYRLRVVHLLIRYIRHLPPHAPGAKELSLAKSTVQLS